MWKQVFFFLLFLNYNTAYDRELYKNCSRVDLCSQNRELSRQTRYRAILEGALFVQGVATFRVQNVAATEFFVLNVTAIENGIFRVQFEEEDSSRYHLDLVLDGEPPVVNFDDVQLSLTTAALVIGNYRAIVNMSPFSIEFYSGDLLQVVLEGDRMTLQNLNNSTPFTFGLNFAQAVRLYGLHEHADSLALHTTAPEGADPYRVRTLDLTYYELFDTQAMYGAVPVLYGHGQSSTSGIFVHNAAEEWVEITNNEKGGSEAFFMVDSGAFDIFLLLGPSPADAVRQYTSLTGLPHLPPFWSLGYHQCRWGYWDQQDLQTVIAEMDGHNFPVDVIWLDIQHTDDNKFFTWNPENFSDPFDMLANLSATNRHLITLTDPHFKKEEGYFIYEEGLERDFFVKNPNGTVFEGECWPGTSVWMDYLNPEARDYYSSLYLYKNWNGTTPTLGGIWNDMNEAAIFNEDNEKTFPYDVVHYGGVANRDIHNMYGLLQIMSTHKGLMDRDNGTRRPFILTRAHFAGTQRYAAVWTGDNTAEWGFIPISYSMCLSSALVGISFCGADVGGFWGEPSDELLQRFFQSGAWLPFYREHSGQESARREPYLFSAEVQDVLREAIRLRYKHLPFWYTVFYEHIRNGDPIIRPLWYHYPEDPEVFEIDDQLLVGSDVLVKAVAEPNVTSVQMFFPGGENLKWFDIRMNDDFYRGVGWTEVPVTIDRIPVFYRQGSIVPVKTIRKSTTADMKDDFHLLYILLNDNFTAAGNVYLDDYESFDYLESRRYNYMRFIADYRDSTILALPIDASNSEGLDIRIGVYVYIVPEEDKNGVLTGKYIQRSFNSTAEGTPLSEIKLTGKQSFTIRLK